MYKRQVYEWRPIAQRAGLALDDGDVVLPVVVGAVTLETTGMTRHYRLADDHDQFERIHPQACLLYTSRCV